jgi:hypothetical protein
VLRSPTTIVATILLVASEHRARRPNDAQWLLPWSRLRHDPSPRIKALKRHHGREIDTAGDGFFAAFNDHGQAVMLGKPRCWGESSEGSLSWWAPASDGGSPITGYVVTASPGGQTATDFQTFESGGLTYYYAELSGLTNGSDYTFSVVATNLIGNSPPSTSSCPQP